MAACIQLSSNCAAGSSTRNSCLLRAHCQKPTLRRSISRTGQLAGGAAVPDRYPCPYDELVFIARVAERFLNKLDLICVARNASARIQPPRIPASARPLAGSQPQPLILPARTYCIDRRLLSRLRMICRQPQGPSASTHGRLVGHPATSARPCGDSALRARISVRHRQQQLAMHQRFPVVSPPPAALDTRRIQYHHKPAQTQVRSGLGSISVHLTAAMGCAPGSGAASCSLPDRSRGNCAKSPESHSGAVRNSCTHAR